MAQVRLTSKGILSLFIVLGLIMFGLGFGFWKIVGSEYISPADSSAGQNACSSYTSKKECGGCGIVKGNGESYACVWRTESGCREGGQLCTGGVDANPGAGACTNVTIDQTGHNKRCNPGAVQCQQVGGKNTGYKEQCIDQSITNSCNTYWKVVGVDTKACPTSSPVSSGGAGNCMNPSPNANGSTSSLTFSVCKCPNQTQQDGISEGCHENCQTVNQSTGGWPTVSVGSSFCGWVQIDQVGGVKVGDNELTCFKSQYYPCSTNEPPPPTDTPTNICDGGAVTAPGNSDNYSVGDVITLSGYAYDVDGINKDKIVVRVNGAVAGNATAVDKTCPAGATDASCVAAKGKKVVEWQYIYTVTTAGALSFAVKWEDTKGITGASCEGARTVTSNIQGNPDWEISKSGVSVCIDETAGVQKAKVDYTIVVKNVGDLAGQLSSLVDTLDSKVQNSFVQNSTIVPTGTLANGTLSWSMEGEDGQFDVNESKIYRYSMIVPQSAFGNYTNTVVATPDGGDAFEAIEVVVVGCNAPDTAIFDSTASKVALGLILIIASSAYMYSDGKIVDRFVKRKDRKKEFENRVAGN